MSVREASPSQLHARVREYKCAQVIIISGQSVLNIDGGSNDRALDVNFSR